MNSLCQLLDIEYPILNAPMGNTSGGKLAAAVSAAGGLGVIGVGYNDNQWLLQQIKLAQQQPFAIGFLSWLLQEQDDLLTTALAANPVAIILSFGDPNEFIDRILHTQCKIIINVHTKEEAKRAQHLKADALIVQGNEAGGHIYKNGLPRDELLQQTLNIISDIPIIAAGGMSDATDIKHVLKLGASGVMLGTRFISSEEALSSSAKKLAVIEHTTNDLQTTNVIDIARGLPWPEQYIGKIIANTFSQKWTGQEQELQQFLLQHPDYYLQAQTHNDLSVLGIFAGDGISKLHKIQSANEIMNELCLAFHR